MEANETNYSRDNDTNDDIDDATRIVSEVIHEYDVIDDQAKICQQKNDTQNETDDKNKHSIKNISAPQQTPPSEQNYGDSSSDVSNRNRLSSSDRSNSITESLPNAVIYPKVNCKEKIVSL